MSKRLLEVATELNVGTKSIVEHLRSNGFEISEKPNTKVSPEMYDVLVKHFQKAIAIKEKAEQLSLVGQRKKEEKGKEKIKPWEKPSLANKESQILKEYELRQQQQTEQPTDNTQPTPMAEGEYTVADNTNVVEHTTSTADHADHETKEDDDVLKTETPQLRGPKILGKINLDEKKSTPKTHTPNQNQQKPQHQQNKGQSGNKDYTRNEQRGNREERNKNQQGNQHREKNYATAYTKPQQHNQQEQNPTTPVEPTPSQDELEKMPTPELENALDMENDAANSADALDNSYRAETPQLKGLKILGKINLEKPKPAAPTPSPTTNSGAKTPQQQYTKKGAHNHQQNQQQGQGGNRDRNQQRGGNNQNRNNQQGQGQNKNNQQQSQQGGTKFVREDLRTKSELENDKKRQLVASSASPTTSTSTPASSTSAGDDKKKRKRIVSNEAPAKGKPAASGAKTGGKKREITNREVDDAVKATMARVRGNQKKKKIGTTRSERAERKEQQRLQNEGEEQDAILQVTEFVSVSELANLIDVSPTEIITTCMNLGVFVSINQRLDAEIIELVASEFSYTVEFISAEEQMEMDDEDEIDAEEDLQPRSPIVTVMGHVDHGKTSLLDYIRKANVASGEAGGITQHIGAYEVSVSNMGKITFLDTPGHEAFTAMRARGAKVTDIAVIIVAADDDVMPQTKEAISHAQAAGVPIIFAINKIDKEGANPERIKQELASMNYLVEDWGGKYQSQDISAKKGLNVDLLLEKILLEAEMLNLRGNPARRAIGTVLEASLEKGRGYVAKILVQTGTLRVGDPIVAGQYSGKVKAMFNERGKNVKIAGPSTPVLVLGLEGAPQAGEKLKVMESERDAKDLAAKRAQLARQQQIRATKRMTLDEIARRLKVGNFKELNLIVKGDMDGSVEALSDSLIKLSNQQVQTRIVYKAVGPITESDVNLAVASDAIIVGFQVRPNSSAKKLAEQEGVQIKTYSIIYDAIDEVKAALEGLLQPKQVEQELGTVEIRQVFEISKVGKVAGCFVQEGKITRHSFIRVVRNGIVVFPNKEGVQGELASLRRMKDTVAEVKAGFECGLTIKNFDNIREGDLVEAYEIVEVKQKLEDFDKK